MNDRDDLLKNLSIDASRKKVTKGSARTWGPVALIVVFAASAYWLFGSAPGAIVAPPDTFEPEPATTGINTANTPAKNQVEQIRQASTGADNRAEPARPASVLDAAGFIIARRRATISAEITGRVEEILVEEGMMVAKGQVVARLDSAIAQVDLQLAGSQVLVAEANVDDLKARVTEAERVLARTRTLSSNSYSSQADLTRAQSNVASLKAQLARAQAEVEVAKITVARRRERLDDHTVTAPFAGVVIDKNAQPGEIVAPGSAGGGFTRTGICTIVDMDSLEVEVDVNESFIGRVFEGQKVIARLDAYPDWEIPARVIAIIPTANRDKATVQVRIGLDIKDKRILPDMGTKVSFMGESA